MSPVESLRRITDPVPGQHESHPLRNGAILIGLVTFLFVAAVLHLPLLPSGGETVKAEFLNAAQVFDNANAPRTKVRIGGVDVGEVESVDPGSSARTSIVTMRLNYETEDFTIKRDARADIRWRTILGGTM